MSTASKKKSFKTSTVVFAHKGHNFKVTTYKPNAVIDDEVFSSKEAWLTHSRGSAQVMYEDNIVATLSGLPKFGYVGEFHNDPNDVAEEGREFHLIEKENGEWFGVCAFEHDHQLYLCGGSKNVKLVCLLPMDAHTFEKQDGWGNEMERQFEEMGHSEDVLNSFAIPMMRKFVTDYATPTVVKYLVTSKMTLVGESCNPATVHIVTYEEWQMRFFVLQDKHDPSTGMMRMNPMVVRQTLIDLGLPVATDHQVARTDTELSTAYERFENKPNSEGAVVYVWGYKKDDRTTPSVWSIFKHKNRRYVLERALREKMKVMADPFVIRKRFSQLALGNVSEEEISDMIGFYAWCLNRFDGKSDATEFKQIFNHWPTLMSEFMALPIAIRQSTSYPILKKKVVQLIGVPGVGKNVITEQLLAWILDNGELGIYVDQDLCQRDVRKFLQRVRELLLDERYDYVLIGKNAHDAHQRSSIYGIMGVYTFDYWLFDLATGVTIEDVPTLVDRIRKREHPTLTKETPDIEGIVTGFITSRKPFTPNEIEGRSFRLQNAIELPWELDIQDKVHKIGKELALAGIPLGKRVPLFLYIGIEIKDERLKKMGAPKVGKLRNEFHVTLVHGFDTRESQEILVRLAPHLGKEVTIRLEELAWNDRVAAIRVNLLDDTIPCQNTIPHITVSLIHDAKPIESNAMLMGEHQSVSYQDPWICSGIIRGYWQ